MKVRLTFEVIVDVEKEKVDETITALKTFANTLDPDSALECIGNEELGESGDEGESKND